MKNFNQLIDIAHDICKGNEAQYEGPFGYVIISHKRHDGTSYIALEAGSKDRFVNVQGYRRFARILISCDSLGFLGNPHPHKGWGKSYWS